MGLLGLVIPAREESKLWNTGEGKGHKSIPSTVSQGWKLQRRSNDFKAQQGEGVEGKMSFSRGGGGRGDGGESKLGHPNRMKTCLVRRTRDFTSFPGVIPFSQFLTSDLDNNVVVNIISGRLRPERRHIKQMFFKKSKSRDPNHKVQIEFQKLVKTQSEFVSEIPLVM